MKNFVIIFILGRYVVDNGEERKYFRLFSNALKDARARDGEIGDILVGSVFETD